MRYPPLNCVPLGQLGRPFMPPRREQPMVRARVVTSSGEQWVEGVSYAWTDAAVWVWWADGGDSLLRCDWLPAADVKG